MRGLSLLLLGLAAVFMAVAVFFQIVTVAGDYRAVLVASVVLMTVADLCCGVVYFCERGLRPLAFMIALPSVFIVWEFIRRAPHV